jgi:hypothetical protein
MDKRKPHFLVIFQEIEKDWIHARANYEIIDHGKMLLVKNFLRDLRKIRKAYESENRSHQSG